MVIPIPATARAITMRSLSGRLDRGLGSPSVCRPIEMGNNCSEGGGLEELS